jgi:hypothetical protein
MNINSPSKKTEIIFLNHHNLESINMLYKVTSRYTAKFLAGHYIIGELLSNDVLPC